LSYARSVAGILPRYRAHSTRWQCRQDWAQCGRGGHKIASRTMSSCAGVRSRSMPIGNGHLGPTDDVFKRFRAPFSASSPVCIFLGTPQRIRSRGFDAVLGRRAPSRHRGGPGDARGLLHEVISDGFWPGAAPWPDGVLRYAAPRARGACETSSPCPAPCPTEGYGQSSSYPTAAVRAASSPATRCWHSSRLLRRAEDSRSGPRRAERQH